MSELHSSRRDTEAMLLMYQLWKPWGGPPPNEIFVSFGVSVAEFSRRVRQLLSENVTPE